MAEPILTAEGLTKRFGRGRLFGRAGHPPALDNGSLRLSAGEILGVVGESGSGKTTLARCLAGLDRPDSGTVLFHGEDLLSLRGGRLRSVRRRIQMIFQDPFASLNPRLRVGQAIGEVIRVHGLASGPAIAERVASLLDQVGLPPATAANYPAAFSGGQRQRICIARALAAQPEILIADEPVSSLDVSIQAQIVNLLLDLRDRLGLTILFIGHDLPLIDFIAPRKIVMFGGRMVETLDAGVRLTDAAHPYTKQLLAAVPTLHRRPPEGPSLRSPDNGGL